MASSGMFRCVAVVRTDVSEELSTSIIGMTIIGELGTLAVTSIPSFPILFTLVRKELNSSETSVLTRATWRNISEYVIIHNQMIF
jgi:hypothetical protein